MIFPKGKHLNWVSGLPVIPVAALTGFRIGGKTLKLFGYPPFLFENLLNNEMEKLKRNRNIRLVLEEKYGYKILWKRGDGKTHLAVRA